MIKDKNRAGRRKDLMLIRQVNTAMTTIMDPATPAIDIFNMGMIYDIRVAEAGPASRLVEMDLAYSSPGLPENAGLIEQITATVEEIAGVTKCQVIVVEDPPWTMDRVTEYARIHLSVVGGSD